MIRKRKELKQKRGDERRLIKDNMAASPVIGVMLMVVVTVILAAAVSSYSSGIAKPTATAPAGSWDVKIKNTGYWRDSQIAMTYLSGVDVPSKDIKIVMEHKGNVTEAKPLTTNVHYSINGGTTWTNYSGPIGFVNDSWRGYGVYPENMQFGNYTIKSGVMMRASPTDGYGGNFTTIETLYEYNQGGSSNKGDDPTEALLDDWQYVRPGDTVSVQIVHIPSGKAVFKADVIVTG